MKRNTTLTLIMMLSSVAAAVAAPESPTHGTMAACIEHQQIAAVTHTEAVPQQLIASPTASRQGVAARQTENCSGDVTAPYRRLNHGGMKLPAGCAEST